MQQKTCYFIKNKTKQNKEKKVALCLQIQYMN